MKINFLNCRTSLISILILIPIIFYTRFSNASCEKPDVLLILDRSVSMARNHVPEGETRWEAAKIAIEEILATFSERIDFGLMVFPYPDRCHPGRVVVEPGVDSSAAISEFLEIPIPDRGNWTPIASTLEEAVTFFSQSPPLPGSAKIHAILITDGEEWCYPYDPATRFDPISSARELVELGVFLHVIGFGGEGVDAFVLNQIAWESGTYKAGCNPFQDDPFASDNCYHNAFDIETLKEALEVISLHTTDERCDAVDNDCDTLIDENLTRECTSPCGTGVERCQNGAWIDCTAPLRSEEICNGKDDNCNGTIDENCPCIAGEKQECGTNIGECKTGIQTCSPEGWSVCEGAKWAEKEICDGLDNDCNGQIDDGNICPPNGFCIEGKCIYPSPKPHVPFFENTFTNEEEIEKPGCGCNIVL